MKRVMLVLAVLVLTAAAASADVTMTMTMTMSTGPMTMDGTVTTAVKGSKVRIDTKMVNQEITLLGDSAAKQIWQLNPATKQLEPYNPQQAMGALPVEIGEPKVSVTPTGQTKDVIGRICQGFTVEMSMPMTLNGETVSLKMFGPMWLAKDGPGVAELMAFQKSFQELGLALSPLGSGPQAKALIEASKSLSSSGVALEQQFTITMEGTGQVAQAMSQMGGMSMTMKVTNISADVIPDEKFAAPEGYTTKK
jgi:hypothetical protein